MTTIYDCSECGQRAASYTAPDGTELLLCDDHAILAGFCPGCHLVMAGADDDHLARHGLCYECWQELRAETGELDEEWNE